MGYYQELVRMRKKVILFITKSGDHGISVDDIKCQILPNFEVGELAITKWLQNLESSGRITKNLEGRYTWQK